VSQLKFDESGTFIPQIVKLNVKRNELDEEMIEKYIKNDCNFQIEYNKRGEPQFIKKIQ